MKFSIIAAVLATVSAAAPLVADGQQPLPKKFSLTFTSDSPAMVGTPATVVVDRNGVFDLLMGTQSQLEGGRQLAVFDVDGDNITLNNDGTVYPFGIDTAGYAQFYRLVRFEGWPLPLQPGTFAQVDGAFAFNAGDGHGPPTTQWKACVDRSYGAWSIVWNRPECISINLQVVPM